MRKEEFESFSDPSVAGVILAINRRRVLFISVVSSFILASGILAFSMTPIYRASALVAPSEQWDVAGGLANSSEASSLLASVAGIRLGGSANRKHEMIATLKSRAFTTEFIEENNLLHVLFAENWDSNSGSWKQGKGSPPPSVYEAYRKFDRDIRGVSEDRVTGLITLTVDWEDKPTAAVWANAILTKLNVYMANKAAAESRRNIEFLKEELARTEVQGVRDSIHGLIQAQLNNIMIANSSDEFAVKIIDPATVPTKYDKVRPRRALMLLIGGLVGMLFATIVIVITESMRKQTIS